MRSLTVEVLGPLRVSVDGRAIELPAGRLRALLAVLAMAAGSPVPTDRVATAVWGADAHGDLRGNVRTNIKRLRRALGSAGQLIAARPGGYLLAAEPDDVDALRFGRLLEEGAGASDPTVERLRLTAALSLWRGTPFDGIRSEWLEQSAGLALWERYLTAVERRIDLDLASGVPIAGTDLAELVELAERHPLREPLWARLLRILQSAGRPAEALERYETIRGRLVEELGADPSSELRQIHADLLVGGATPGKRTAPRQLPAAVGGFAGRKAAMAALDALLGPLDETRSLSPLIAVIAGTAGVGKTTLAVQFAHRVAERFPDGQLYLDLRGYGPSGEPVRPGAAIADLLSALQVPPDRIPDSLEAQAGLYRSLLAGRRVLVLLDNAREADQVAPLLPAAPGCLVVVTSRDHLTGFVTAYGAHPLTLDVLPPDEATQVLAYRLGYDRITAEPAAVDEIVRRCAGLPLALAIVAARAAIHPAHPLGALARELENALGTLDRAVDVRAIFSWSYETLSDPAARLFRLAAGLHPGRDTTVAAAASLVGVPVGRVAAPLSELTGANLLTEHVPGRYSCHDLLRAYAWELAAALDPDLEAARHRVVGHYVHTAYAAAVVHLHGEVEASAPATPNAGISVTEFTCPDDALAWFTVERPALLDVLRLATDLRLDRHVCRLSRVLFDVLHRQGRWHDRVESQRVALAAARRLDDPVEETRAHRNLAVALADLGRFDDAHDNLDAALERSQEDPVGRAWTHYHRDLVYAIQGRSADALDAARRAHDLFDQLGDRVGQAIALTNLGWHHGRLGNHEQALHLCERALVLHQKLGNRGHEAHTLSCLAEIHLHLGDIAGAVRCYGQCLDLFREFGDRYAEASILAHLGACHYLGGRQTVAHEQWRDAHALLGDLDTPTTDQIHTQLSIVDKAAADAFYRLR